MRNVSGHTLARQWAMLRSIPRWPQKVTVSELRSTLLDRGYHTVRRTIERDLQELSDHFPLVVDETGKPYGWSWARDANFEFAPRLTTPQSVALLLSRTHLRNLLPQSMFKDLAPMFGIAEKELTATGWKDWDKRTAVIPMSMPLLPPKLNPSVIEHVQTALARGRCLAGHYQSRGNKTAKEVTVHPLGLLVRGAVQYLVCTLFDYTDVRQLALHRLSNTSVLAMPCAQPPGFDFTRHISTASKYHAQGKIRLVAWFDETAAEHLKETPVSHDQSLRAIDDMDRVELIASVESDETLRWWLLGFGSRVEVKEPATLREELKADLQKALRMYEAIA